MRAKDHYSGCVYTVNIYADEQKVSVPGSADANTLIKKLMKSGKTTLLLALADYAFGSSEFWKNNIAFGTCRTARTWIARTRIASTVKAIVNERIGNGEVSNKQGIRGREDVSVIRCRKKICLRLRIAPLAE
ncbi:hypothetical protein Syun_027766 [Stephania yunnanensis]|uniref:Uncharacterized protein n=1 Tax=Stephania yunnanensis TaxID=152371 RepID=A0AAP0EIK6_9MAGN